MSLSLGAVLGTRFRVSGSFWPLRSSLYLPSVQTARAFLSISDLH